MLLGKETVLKSDDQVRQYFVFLLFSTKYLVFCKDMVCFQKKEAKLSSLTL